MKKEKYGAKVYSKSVEGYKIKAFKVVSEIDADAETIYKVIMDIENYPEWYPDCKKGELLEKTNPDEQLRRTIYNLPWPFDPRDAINRATGRQVGENKWIVLSNEENKIPETKKVIRIPRTEGYWLLEPIEGSTKIHYSAVGEAPGVPTWIVNLFVFDGPLKAIKNLKEVVKNDRK